MNNKLVSFLSVVFLLITSTVICQTPQVVEWQSSVESGKDGLYQVTHQATVKKGWNIYSTKKSKEGPIPTSFAYENAKVIGDTKEVGSFKTNLDPFFEVEITKATGAPSFIQTVKSATSTIKGTLTYMVCNDKTCLPPEDIPFSVDASKAAPIASNITTKAKEKTAKSSVAKKEADLSSRRLETEQQKASPTYQGFDLTNFVVSCFDEKKKPTGLLSLFLLGFGGGLIALLTPCVFPMIPITVGFFHQEDKDGNINTGKSIKNAIIYGLSIIAIYVGLGTLITGVFGADALASIATNWIVNLVFFGLFVVFALSFFGLFEITLPSAWMNKADTLSRSKGGLAGIFFMAATLAIVSFSCTGPIIGTQLMESATSPFASGPIVTMLGFSIALALPFTIFAAFPGLMNSLPSSGGWLNSVKIILGFLELAFAFKFLSAVDLTKGWGILKYETFLVIWILVALGLLLYLLGIIRFKYDSKLTSLPVWRIALSILTFGFIIYLGSGFFSNKSLGLLSGIAPPIEHSWFENKTLDIDASGLTECAGGIPCFKDYEQGLAFAKAVDKPIMLDFTGHNCENCRKIEQKIWPDEEVKKALSEDFVLISLYQDDTKKLPKDQQFKSEASGRKKTIRKVGNYWTDFQMSNFGDLAMPQYYMLSNDGEVLSKPFDWETGNTPELFMKNVNCGLAQN